MQYRHYDPTTRTSHEHTRSQRGPDVATMESTVRPALIMNVPDDVVVSIQSLYSDALGSSRRSAEEDNHHRARSLHLDKS